MFTEFIHAHGVPTHSAEAGMTVAALLDVWCLVIELSKPKRWSSPIPGLGFFSRGSSTFSWHFSAVSLFRSLEIRKCSSGFSTLSC